MHVKDTRGHIRLKCDPERGVHHVDAAVTAAGTAVRPFEAEQLYRATDLSNLKFSTTAELQPIDGLVGQARALEAIRFGTQVDKTGFNLFVIGPNGARMQDAVKALLAERRARKAQPIRLGLCQQFRRCGQAGRHRASGRRARKFHDAMHKLIDDLKTALPAVFQSEDYQTRRGAIDESFQKKQGEAFSALRDKAAEKDIVLLRTPLGFALAPAKDGQVVPPDEFTTWPEAKRREVQATIEALEKDLEHIIHQFPQWETQRRDEVRQLNRETAKYAVDQLIEDTKAAFKDIPRVIQHIETVRADLVENVGIFVVKGEDDESEPGEFRPGSPFDRYEVNVLVTQDGDKPASDRRRAASGARQPDRPHRVHPAARRAGDQFPPHQGRRDASRQWRLSAARCPQRSAGAVQLGGAQAHAAAGRDRHRRHRAVSWLHQHGVA